MSLRTKQYIIPLRPLPWTRAGLHGKQFFDRQKQEKLAYGLYLQRQHGKEPLFEGPLSLDITFHFRTPALKRERHVHGWHFCRPDIDNLGKLCMDSINSCGSIWHDDAQVSEIIMRKNYNKIAELIITIKELT